MLSENVQKTKTSRRSSLIRLLHKQSVAQAAVLIAVVTFLSKFVGFAREVVIARQFGATGQTDAFLVGMMVPSLVLGLFAGGLGTLIVPWYLGQKKEDPERARLLVDQIALVWGIVFALVCVGVWAYAPQLVHIFAFKDTVTPLLVGLGIVGANVAGNVILSKYLGAAGIALATTITVSLGTIIYAILLRRTFRTEDRVSPTYPLWDQMLRTLMATVPVGLIAWLGLRWVAPTRAFIPLLLRTMAVCGVAALAYAVCSIALHLDGWLAIQGRFTRLAHGLRGM